MADFEQRIDWPFWAAPDTSVVARSRLVLGTRMKANVDLTANKAAGETPFESIAKEYFTGEEYAGSLITVGVGNPAPHFHFWGEDMPAHDVPPVSAPLSPFEAWVGHVGASVTPWYARNKVALAGFHHPGHTGAHVLESAWEEDLPALEETIDLTYTELIATWGAV